MDLGPPSHNAPNDHAAQTAGIFHSIVAQLDAAVITIDAQQRVRFINRTAENWYGVDASRINGESLASLCRLVWLSPAAANAASAAIRENKIWSGEMVHVTTHGREILTETTIQPIVDGQGIHTGTAYIAREVKSQKENTRQNDQEPQWQRAMFEGIVRTTDIMLVHLDRDFRFISVNEAYATTCRMSQQEMVGKNHFDLYPHEENEAIFKRVRDTGAPAFVKDKPFVFPDQPERGVTYWDWSLVPVKRADGYVVGLIFSLQETTVAVRNKMALEESEAKLRMALAGARIGTWALDAMTGLQEASPLTRELWKFDPDGPIPTALEWYNRVHPDDRERVRGTFEQSSAQGCNFCSDYRIVWPDGSIRWLESRATPQLDAAGKVSRFIGTTMDITERKTAELQIKQSEQKLRRILNASPMGTLVGREDGEVLDANDSYLQLVGYTRQDLKESRIRWDTLTPPEYLHLDRAAIIQAKAGGYSGLYEKEYVRSDGVRVPVLIACASLGNGELAGLVLNLTDQKRNEQALRQGEARIRQQHEELSSIYQNAPVGMCILDRSLRYMRINQRLADINGIPVDQHLGRTVFDVIPAIAPQVKQITTRILETGEPVNDVEFAGETPAAPGVLRYWNESWYPVRDEHGCITGFGTVVEEITERRRSEMETNRHRQLLQSVLDHLPSAVAIVRGSDLRYQLANPSYVALANCQDIVGKSIIEVWPETHDTFRERCDQVLASGRPYRATDEPFGLTNPATGKKELRYFNWSIHEIDLPADAGPGLVVTAWETTDRKNAEAALAAAKDSAEAASKAKDHFLAILSHELRTPLNPALIAATILERSPRLPEDLKDDVGVIRRNIELEARLIDDMLDLTRITRGKLNLNRQIVNGCEVLRHAANTCEADTAEKDLKLELQLPETPIWVDADPARMQQVFWNLLKNAIKFTPSHGVITLRASITQDRHMRVEVKDNGRGIDRDLLPRIFDAFEQGDPQVNKNFGGLGLGLAICKGLVTLHHGTIQALSEGSGRGATFIVELPAVAQAPQLRPESQTVHQQPASIHAGSTCRILLVEDHESTAVMTGRLLQSMGYSVARAHSMKEAREIYTQNEFDLIISDLGLPDGSGHLLVQQLAAIRPVKAIALSGYGMESDVQRSYSVGFQEHLTKPVNVQRLDEAIRRSIGGKS